MLEETTPAQRVARGLYLLVKCNSCNVTLLTFTHSSHTHSADVTWGSTGTADAETADGDGREVKA